MPSMRDLPVLDLVEAGQQVDDGGLAGPGWAHQGDGLPGSGFQGHVLDDRGARLVAEADVLEAHMPLSRLQRQGIGSILDLRRGVDDLEDPLRAGQRRLDGVVHVGKLLQRA